MGISKYTLTSGAFHRFRVSFALLWMSGFILTASGASGAETDYGIHPINPVPAIPYGVVYMNIEEEPSFDDVGVIEQIENGFVIVSDVYRKVARDVRYHSLDGTAVFYSSIRVGATVGYRMNDSREITDMWLLKR